MIFVNQVIDHELGKTKCLLLSFCLLDLEVTGINASYCLCSINDILGQHHAREEGCRVDKNIKPQKKAAVSENISLEGPTRTPKPYSSVSTIFSSVTKYHPRILPRKNGHSRATTSVSKHSLFAYSIPLHLPAPLSHKYLLYILLYPIPSFSKWHYFPTGILKLADIHLFHKFLTFHHLSMTKLFYCFSQ